jgi:hypothetical protein
MRRGGEQCHRGRLSPASGGQAPWKPHGQGARQRRGPAAHRQRQRIRRVQVSEHQRSPAGLPASFRSRLQAGLQLPGVAARRGAAPAGRQGRHHRHRVRRAYHPCSNADGRSDHPDVAAQSHDSSQPRGCQPDRASGSSVRRRRSSGQTDEGSQTRACGPSVAQPGPEETVRTRRNEWPPRTLREEDRLVRPPLPGVGWSGRVVP